MVDLLIVYVPPVLKYPFPVPAPPSGPPLPSTIESLSIRSRRTFPSPVPVLTVTVYKLPIPCTPAIEAPVMLPVVDRAKSLVSTPVTCLENVTLKRTAWAMVGLGSLLVMLVTVGKFLSTT